MDASGHVSTRAFAELGKQFNEIAKYENNPVAHSRGGVNDEFMKAYHDRTPGKEMPFHWRFGTAFYGRPYPSTLWDQLDRAVALGSVAAFVHSPAEEE